MVEETKRNISLKWMWTAITIKKINFSRLTLIKSLIWKINSLES
jgi:hypothetical protein